MPQLDRAVLERLRATVGDDTFAELVKEFLRDSRRLEQALRDAVAAKDVEAARVSAHELKGLAVLFGAEKLAKLCTKTDLEKASQAAELTGEVREALIGTTQKRRTGAA